MRLIHSIVLSLAIVVPSAGSFVQAQTSTPAEEIRAVLNKQVADWNRGDLDAFATGYKNSPDILFIGSKISRGYAQMVDSYRRGYPTREKMGTLSFSQLEVQPLDEHFATVTGHFHLERAVAGGGNADGHFLLVTEKTPGGWKIVRDDTTATPKEAAK
jgi:ketosteroid isomerase-like protein